jgi:alpha-L-fucosidase
MKFMSLNKMKIKNVLYIIANMILTVTSFCAEAQHNIPVPNRQQLAWQKAEFGLVFHYDLHVFDGKRYVQSRNRILPLADYNVFNPSQIDVEQWVLAAKDAGAKFAILTATHETGFALFQSEVNPYSLKAVNWNEGKADIVRDFVEACRKHGLEPGIYLGIRWNSFFGVHDFKVSGSGQMQKNRQAYYNKMVEGMVKEICSNYGSLFEIWFDGGASSPGRGAPDVLPIVKEYQPNCLFYHNDQLAEARWGGSESGTVGYPNWATFPYVSTGAGEHISENEFALLKHGDPEGRYWMPAMADAPLRGYNSRHEWFWEPGDEEHIYPLEELVNMYYKSVGRNATLILGLTPDTTGLLPLADVNRLKEFGKEISRRFSKPVASASQQGMQVQINFPKAQAINQFVIQEEIAKGHRVKQFSVWAFVGGKWKELLEGESIGNKYIHLLEKPIVAKRFRLKIEDAVAEPEISNFALYYVPPLSK